jgi:hypothetical protein
MFLFAVTASAVPLSVPAHAQVSNEVVLNIMRECGKIDDPTARLACYDNNIRQAGPTTRTSVPGRMQVPQGGAAPVDANSPQNFGFNTVRSSSPPPPPPPGAANTSAPQGFGAENVRTPQRFEPAGVQAIHPRVSTIRQREPGVYLMTMEDDTQWVFSDGVSSSYRVPQAGSTVEIERGALGSYLLRFDSQGPVQVRRTR